MRARKKPVVVDCFKTSIGESAEEAISFCDGAAYVKVNDNQLYIRTLEGDMLCSIGDYIIKGVNGEFYPCKPDIFEKTYDIIND